MPPCRECNAFSIWMATFALGKTLLIVEHCGWFYQMYLQGQTSLSLHEHHLWPGKDGLSVIMDCKLAGAPTFLGIDLSKNKFEKTISMGATKCIKPQTQAHWCDAVRNDRRHRGLQDNVPKPVTDFLAKKFDLDQLISYVLPFKIKAVKNLRSLFV
ncbi:hypothetical protein GH733_016410, partial [Mirounga leonina]